MQDSMRIGIQADKIVTIFNIESDLQQEVHKNEQLQKENEELHKRWNDLYIQMTEAQATTIQLNASLDEASDTILKLEEENQQLNSYINELAQDLHFRMSDSRGERLKSSGPKLRKHCGLQRPSDLICSLCHY